MNRLERMLAALGGLVAILLTGCAADGTGVSYDQAVAKVESMLGAKVDHGIFPYQKEAGDDQTTFRFVEGSMTNKADHVTPLRVAVTIHRLDNGRGSTYDVDAHEHGIVMKMRDRDAKARWSEEVGRAITP